MLLHQFPDLNWLKSQANSRFSNRQAVGGGLLKNEGWPSVVLNAKAKGVIRDNIRGPLSLFCNVSGLSHVTVDKRRVALAPGSFFLSNADQHYTLEIADKTPAETFNIHVGEQFAQTAFQSLLASPEQSLENENSDGTPGFHNRIVPATAEFTAVLNSIRANGKDELFLEEQLYRVLNLLVAENKKVRDMQQRIQALKSATREEILKRLLITTDYLHAYYDKNPSLDALAKISCLSKFHFLRLFKSAYGRTPHQFITDLKITKAKELLSATQTDVASVARTLGFDNASTFSRLFHHQTGLYPTQFRSSTWR